MPRTFDGTSGNDTFIFQYAYPGETDSLVANGNGGNDLIVGFTQNDFLAGGDGNDSLYGGAGNDTLIGGLGNDSMRGGTGDDIYYVDHPEDVVLENPNEGIDTIFATGLGVMPGNVENLTLYNLDLRTSYGSQGNSLNNVMRTLSDTQVAFGGGAGDDTLYGGNGRYSDLLYGETGNDVLYGNAGNDDLNGGEGNDVLDGGTGNDSMEGGLGNDTYYMDNRGDVVTENLNEGSDTVISSVSYLLGNNLETLVLTGTATRGIGNNLDNTIYGTDQASSLRGQAGNDAIYGGAGNDNINGNEGNDTLSGGAGNDTIIGEKGSDYLTGGAGNDVLIGYGGVGEIDILIGGRGSDTFAVGVSYARFGAGSGSGGLVGYTDDGNAGYALILDFNWNDFIELKGDISQYTFGTGNVTGTAALDTTIYYNGASGLDLIAVVQDTTDVTVDNLVFFS